MEHRTFDGRRRAGIFLNLAQPLAIAASYANSETESSS
jgi:hypothetical protein